MAERAATILRGLAFSLLLAAGLAAPLAAKEAAPVAVDEKTEARMMALASELRCLVCQNQTIADSHAELAVDLRGQIREMIAKGQSDGQIMDYMTERYGDFVLYRPPFKATTLLLWAGPAVLLLVAVGLLINVLRRRQRLGADAYDPDSPEEIR
jgi:cytochrome c-type biogenesis protein CcmH